VIFLIRVILGDSSFAQTREIPSYHAVIDREGQERIAKFFPSSKYILALLPIEN
jgi:hypothetical protein